jgi:Pyruvate/2-oxoglutarate dehydrogenase complex, dihydrolipoamide dehydrogenase (E3) component, and related enzymes
MKHAEKDLIVIGAGAGGLTAARFARGLGKDVLLVEKSRIGGECTWTGCVPSKALLAAAKAAHAARTASKWGLSVPEGPVGTEGVMASVRSVVAEVYAGETPEVLEKEGIRVFIGNARFSDPRTVELDGLKTTARRFLVCTGSSPVVPAIPGIGTIRPLTNESVFDLAEVPRSMAVLGAGPIGIELASAFNRLGCRVTVLIRRTGILPKEDPELSSRLQEMLGAEGVVFLEETVPSRVERTEGGVRLWLRKGGPEEPLEAEHLLVAAGRRPNVEGLNLEAAGVRVEEKGIRTDRNLRTTAESIYACGDVTGRTPFSHMAERGAITAVRNAFFPFPKAFDEENALWSTFTDPELARGGLTEEEARSRFGEKIRVYRVEIGSLDRGRAEKAAGLAKFVLDPSGRLAGVSILAPGRENSSTRGWPHECWGFPSTGWTR